MKFVEKKETIEASTTYNNNVLVGVGMKFTIPEIALVTVDTNAMGTMTLPTLGLLEDMESTITKTGVDQNLAAMCTPGTHDIEHRWVQDVISSDGTVSAQGCKVFMKAIPKVIFPEAELEAGSSAEVEVPYTITRLRLVIGGEEILLVDRLAHKLVVDGKDYYQAFDSYL